MYVRSISVARWARRAPHVRAPVGRSPYGACPLRGQSRARHQEATEYSVRFGSVRWKILTEPPNFLFKKWPGIGLFQPSFFNYFTKNFMDFSVNFAIWSMFFVWLVLNTLIVSSFMMCSTQVNNQSKSLFRSRDWLSANQGPVLLTFQENQPKQVNNQSTRYLGQVTGSGYQPIRDQYFLIRFLKCGD
eukprot:sb/3471249/